MGRRCPKCGSPYMTHYVGASMGVSGDYYGYYEYKEWYRCWNCGHIESVKPDKQPKEQHVQS